MHANMQASNVHNMKEWTSGMFSYDQILSGLKEVTAVHRKRGGDSRSSSDAGTSSAVSSEGVAEEASRAAGLGVGAGACKEKKKKAGQKKAAKVGGPVGFWGGGGTRVRGQPGRGRATPI